MSTTATKFEKAKKVCTVGDGDFMFRMHTQPLKLFQIESMSGADPDILLGEGGSNTFGKKLTRKNKKENKNNNKTSDRSRREGCFSTLYPWSMSSEFLLGREGKGGDMVFV